MKSYRDFLPMILHILTFLVVMLVQFVEDLTTRLVASGIMLFVSICIAVYELIASERLRRAHTALQKNVETAEEMAITDELTGLYNYRYLRSFLDDDFVLSLGDDFVLSLIIADVDFFKEYNDKYGHLKGDQLLRWLANVFKESIRESDMVARYGGEEFVIVLPGIDTETAAKIADRIRVRIEKESRLLGESNGEQGVTVSFGIATYPVHARTCNDLLQKADEALYRAKHLRKNTVCVFGQ